MKGLLGLLIVVWLVIGAVAALAARLLRRRPGRQLQERGRHAVTIVAGPLNYMGANPKIECDTPSPPQ